MESTYNLAPDMKPVVGANRLFKITDAHPRILLGIVVVLVLALAFVYLKPKYASMRSMLGGKKESAPTSSEDKETDELIKSIHDKQKK